MDGMEKSRRGKIDKRREEEFRREGGRGVGELDRKRGWIMSASHSWLQAYQYTYHSHNIIRTCTNANIYIHTQAQSDVNYYCLGS